MKRRILIVDDDQQNREILKEALEDNYTIEEAADGQEALFKYQHFKPDLILLDLMMPNLDGRAVLTMIRKQEERSGHLSGQGAVPVIMLTAHQSDWLDSLNNSCDFYIMKPFEANKIRLKISEVLASTNKS